MPKYSLSDLKALLAAEKSDALSAISSSKLSQERSDAMDYYLGDMSNDMPAQEGRSRAVSSDVSDTVEGLMPDLMDILCGSDAVVSFRPVGPEDVQAAEQETDYVNYVFMEENDGFTVLYDFIKDQLLQKNGITKVWHEEIDQEERETYKGQLEDQYALIAQAAVTGEFEIAEHTQNEDGTHDVTIVSTRKLKRDRVMGVPPEEFGIERGARDIKTCNYCFHETSRSIGQLMMQGYDEDQLSRIGTSGPSQNTESIARDTVDEDDVSSDSINDTSRRIQVTEHYVRMDYEDNGKPCIYRIVTAGEGADILNRDGKPDIMKVDVYPFASSTPVRVPHRFFGRSIADLVMDIQRIKTALTRGLLDNVYMRLAPRVEVAEQHAGVNTLDDLLVARPNGIVRTKTPGGLNWQVVPDVASTVYPALQYFDATREWRSGVTRQGQGVDPEALQNQVATIAKQMENASQKKVKLIARLIAEGVKEIFALLHHSIRSNGSEQKTVRLRNKWTTVDPRNWKTRSDMTINVGLGDGSRTDKLAANQILIATQEKGIAAGLVSKRNLWESAKEQCNLLGHKDPTRFFTPPDQQPNPQDPASAAIQPPPDPKLIELQAKNEIEKTQALADAATLEKKSQFDMALATAQFEFDKQLKLLDARLEEIKAMHAMQAREQDAAAKREQQAQDARNGGGAKIEMKLGADATMGMQALMEKIAEIQEGGRAQSEMSNALMEKIAALEARKPPKRIRGPSGKEYEVLN